MIFLNKDIQSKSSIEETDDLSSDVPFSAFLMSEDALVGGEDEVAELSGRQNVVGPLLKIRQQDVVSGRDHTAFVDAADKLYDNLFASVVVNDFKLTDIVVLLHNSQEFEQDFRHRLEENLLFAFAFGIHDGLQGISQDVYLYHFVEIMKSNNQYFNHQIIKKHLKNLQKVLGQFNQARNSAQNLSTTLVALLLIYYQRSAQKSSYLSGSNMLTQKHQCQSLKCHYSSLRRTQVKIQRTDLQQMTISQQKTISTEQQSQPQPDNSPARAFFVSLTVDIVYTVFNAALLITLLLLLFTINLANFKASNSYSRIQQNLFLWQKEIIVDLFVSNAYNCPQGYEEFTNSSWPGNIQGCLCSISIDLYAYDVVLQGQCSQAQFAKSCLNVAPHSSILYTFWHKEAHLCVKRLKNYNFYTSYTDIINPSNLSKKSCAEGKQYQIDLVSAVKCPITQIVNDTTYQEVIKGLSYSYMRERNFPIVQFKISQYGFCQQFSESNISPGRKFNYILQSAQKHQCQSIDNRTITLDSLPQTTLLENNPRINSIISQLPDYPPSDSIYIYKLGYLRYPSWSYQCRSSTQFDLITTTSYLNLAEFQSFHSSTTLVIEVALALQLLYLVYYWLVHYLYLKSKYLLGYLYLKDYEIKKLNKNTNLSKDKQSQLMKLIVVEAFLVVVLIIFVLVYQKSIKIQNWFKSSYSCTDQIMANYLKSYEIFFGSALTYAIACVFITVSVIFLNIIYFVWRRLKGDLQQEPQHQLIQKQMQEISDSIPEQIQAKNRKSCLIQVTQQCLVANAYEQNQENQKQRHNNLHFQLQLERQRPINSPIQISESFYSEDSDKSD